MTAGLSFFQKTPLPDDIAGKIAELEKAKDKLSRIRCPLCRWQPNKTDLWMCGDCALPEYFFGGCYTSWHTFETRGRCPGCGHQWRWTSCLRCHEWSLHEDWYERDMNSTE